MRLRLTAALIASLTLILLAVSATPSTASASPLTIRQLRVELRHARHHLAAARETLRAARADLADARAVLAAMDAAALATEDPGLLPALATLRPELADRLLADGAVTADELAALEARVVKRRGIVRRVRRATHALGTRLERRLQIREWNRRGAWRPLIELAARRYGVSADGLFRLMTYESGGRRLAGSTYKGLFQYHPGTWAAGWNPWRSASIYDGWAQIRATAYAISRGMGPANWPNTYPRAF